MERLNNGLVLTDVDPFRARFDLLNAVVLVVQLLCLEVGDASRCSILEHARVVDHVLHLAPLALDILLEVRVVGDHRADRLAAERAIVLVHRDVVVGDGASIPRHLQLFVNLVHDQL